MREKDLIIKTHITTASNDTNHYVINFDALRNLTSVKTPLVTSENNTLVENLHQQKVIEKDQVKTSEDSILAKNFPETSVKITRNNINNNIYSNSQTSKVNVALSNDSSKFNEDEKKKVGIATITATTKDGGYTANCKVTVEKCAPLPPCDPPEDIE